MSQEVQRAYGKLFNLHTTQYLPCIDWEHRLIKENEGPAPVESLDYKAYPRFLYNPKDRPIFSN